MSGENGAVNSQPVLRIACLLARSLGYNGGVNDDGGVGIRPHPVVYLFRSCIVTRQSHLSIVIGKSPSSVSRLLLLRSNLARNLLHNPSFTFPSLIYGSHDTKMISFYRDAKSIARSALHSLLFNSFSRKPSASLSLPRSCLPGSLFTHHTRLLFVRETWGISEAPNTRSRHPFTNSPQPRCRQQ
ncbi:hypothetical protein BD289DRAFT_432067 [Coniella lustricola]|uniref:Uncharacterized protein n=1 Tax=Coniella lustricola TaxID=2025994 RepID=A0A2T3AA82_9PEZI|nr:hypothetical protein BD289DRAFT_432067 [Coniella lustricola]